MSKRFNEEEINYIKDNINKMKYKDIAQELNVPEGRIRSWVNYNHIKKTQRGIFSEEDIQFMKNNYLTLSYREIAEQLGFTEKQVRGKINNMGLSKLRKFNKEYFSSINATKAYWMGFIYADGWIVYNPYKRNYELGIQLQAQDLYHLETFRDEIGGNHKITSKHFEGIIHNNKVSSVTDSNVLRIFSKSIVTDLMKWNILPNKSDLPNYPVIPNEFFIDFLRGYIDGDGCFYFDTKRHLMFIHITSAHREVLDYIRQTLYSSFEISTSVYQENTKKYRLYCYVQSDCLKLCKLLYYSSDIPYLKRKYEKYLKWLPYTEMYKTKSEISVEASLPIPRTNDITLACNA